MATDIEKRQIAVGKFPGLGTSPFELTSDVDPFYNCIAWAAEESHRGWWPGKGYWPPGCPRLTTPAAFKAAFGTLGYVSCSDGQPEPGKTKVAFYVLGGRVRHAARQLADGRWTSKLGPWIDIAHELEGLEGREYGRASFFMERPTP